MTSIEAQITGKNLENLLLHYKYHDAIKRVARGVTHNYNNIFTGLGGQTSMLRQESSLPGDLPEKRSELIGSLLQRGIDLTTILYGFTRDSDTEKRSQSPLLIATKTLELLNCISRIHRFILRSEIGAEKIFGNTRDIVLALFYLGENCVDATPEGGEIHCRIHLEEQQPGGSAPELAFCFRDHGPGFPADTLLASRTPFITTKSDSPYRGLGLFAASILVQRHHGRLSITRNSGNETLVSAIFPKGAEEIVAPPGIPVDKQRQTAKHSLAKQCFLVVEDDEAMRTLLLNRLQRRGHMVFCVDTCTEALEEYDLLSDIITTVLMDVGLQDTSGYECCRKIVARNPQARIIFMSGQHETATAGGNGRSVFLQKPFTIDQLEQAVYDVHL